MSIIKTIAILFAATLLFIVSCKPENGSTPPPEQVYRDKFLGEYVVTDDTGGTYIMSVVPVDTLGEKAMRVNNFANKFDVTSVLGSTLDKEVTTFNIFFKNPELDHNNDRYDVGLYKDPATSYKDNKLINDTLHLYFRLNNMPYWSEDSSTYVFRFFRHTAVKIK